MMTTTKNWKISDTQKLIRKNIHHRITQVNKVYLATLYTFSTPQRYLDTHITELQLVNGMFTNPYSPVHASTTNSAARVCLY